MKAEDYLIEKRDIKGHEVEVRVYRTGGTYYCNVAIADPGATIARAEGASRDEAVNAALTKAEQRLK